MINPPLSINYTPRSKSWLDFYRECQLVTDYERYYRQINRLRILRNQAQLLGIFEIACEFDTLIAERARLLSIAVQGVQDD